MVLKDWFYNGYSRDELECIFQDLYQQKYQTQFVGSEQWGRCTLAKELEQLTDSDSVAKKFIYS
jgi:hypothetical protein